MILYGLLVCQECVKYGGLHVYGWEGSHMGSDNPHSSLHVRQVSGNIGDCVCSTTRSPDPNLTPSLSYTITFSFTN